ncbi:hypothetical protein CYMTET_18670 [Cymbomonas tetramitiformis]|uniref:Uncharacterized protein n=1 Tax=Cymbomonas tetramitiformis TaxID=36881 RepID=A0AAE0G7K2_9CHLO|nr:hypothetical protein CYMTET_18670 [Cymbomonas tetramitiformis]
MEDVRREVEHLGTVEGQGRGTAEARSGGARAGTGGLKQAASNVEDILNELDDLSSPGPEGGVWTQEQSGASPEQAMALAEGGVATLMGASRRVAGLLGGVDGMGELMRMTGEMWGGPRVELTHAGPLRARGPIPAAMTTYNRLHGSIRHLISFRAHRARLLAVPELTEQCGTTVTAQVWSALLKFAATSQGNQCKGFSHVELVLGLECYRCKSVAGAQVWMRASQFIILSPLGQRLGILAVAWVGKLSRDHDVGGSGVMWDVGLVVEGWLDWRRQHMYAALATAVLHQKVRHKVKLYRCVHSGSHGSTCSDGHLLVWGLGASGDWYFGLEPKHAARVIQALVATADTELRQRKADHGRHLAWPLLQKGPAYIPGFLRTFWRGRMGMARQDKESMFYMLRYAQMEGERN